MEWSWQTVLIILGLISIGLILFDGYRKMQRSRAEALRLNVNNTPNTGEVDEYNPELPGEVRVVSKTDTLREYDLDSTKPPSAGKDASDKERFSALEEDSDESLLFDGYDTSLEAASSEKTEVPTAVHQDKQEDDQQKGDQQEDSHLKANLSPEIIDPPVIPVAKPVDLDEDVPVLLDVEELGSEDNFAKTTATPSQEQLDEPEEPELDQAEASDDSPLDTTSESDIDPQIEVEESIAIDEQVEEASVNGLDELHDPHLENEVEEMPEESSLTDLVNYADPDAETLSSRPEPQMVMVIHTIARDEQGFDGKEILYLFNSCDLRYGEKDIFHRFEETDGKGCIQFSIAQTCNPGTFEPDSMTDTRYPGLSFFLSLPGAKKPLEAYTAMAEMAMAVSRNLNADILDGTHSAMTPQTIEHERQQIMDYERKQRLAAKKRDR